MNWPVDSTFTNFFLENLFILSSLFFSCSCYVLHLQLLFVLFQKIKLALRSSSKFSCPRELFFFSKNNFTFLSLGFYKAMSSSLALIALHHRPEKEKANFYFNSKFLFQQPNLGTYFDFENFFLKVNQTPNINTFGFIDGDGVATRFVNFFFLNACGQKSYLKEAEL